MSEDFLVHLAKDALLTYLTGRDPLYESSLFREDRSGVRAGVYVTLKLNHKLRGRAGTIVARTDNISAETIYNVIRAATVDYVDEPIETDELSELECSVDIIKNLKFVDEIETIDYRKDGIIVTDGWRKAICFPDRKRYTGNEDYIIKNSVKAGINLNKPIHISKFSIEHHE